MADLALYDVPVRGYVTQMKLSKADAELLGGTKVGEVTPATAQPAPTQPWAPTVDQTGAVGEDEPAEPAEKKAPAPRNKARGASAK